MKVRVELRVRLKVIDLVAQTAWMTLTEKLDFAGTLRGMARYSYWGIEAEGTSGEAVLEQIDRVVRLDSAFTNQNKHLYWLGIPGDEAGPATTPRGDLRIEGDCPLMEQDGDEHGEGMFVVDLLVSERGSERDAGYLSRLESRLEGVSVSGVRSGEVWRLVVKAADEQEAGERVEEMAVTRSRREGLLLNPHYQEYSIISSKPLKSVKEI